MPISNISVTCLSIHFGLSNWTSTAVALQEDCRSYQCDPRQFISAPGYHRGRKKLPENTLGAGSSSSSVLCHRQTEIQCAPKISSDGSRTRPSALHSASAGKPHFFLLFIFVAVLKVFKTDQFCGEKLVCFSWRFFPGLLDSQICQKGAWLQVRLCERVHQAHITHFLFTQSRFLRLIRPKRKFRLGKWR